MSKVATTQYSDPELNSYEGMAEFFDALDRLPFEQRPAAFPTMFANMRLASKLVWDLYSHNLCAEYARAHPGQRSTLSEVGFVTGTLEPAHVELLQQIYASCQQKKLDPYDFPPCYFHETRPNFQESMEVINDYYHPSELFFRRMPEIIAPLIGRIEQECGFYWRVASIRLFTVKPADETHGRHVDNWMPAFKKLFFYPNGASRELGSTEITNKQGETLVVEGGPGTWLLFENSLAYHKAYSSISAARRPTIELTLVPAMRTDPTLDYCGAQALHPYFPYEPGNKELKLSSPEMEYSQVHERTLRRVAGLMSLNRLFSFNTRYDLKDIAFDKDDFLRWQPVSEVETLPALQNSVKMTALGALRHAYRLWRGKATP